MSDSPKQHNSATPNFGKQSEPDANVYPPNRESLHDTSDIGEFDGDGQEDNVRLIAYECWQERGCPDGSPDHDWHEATRRVKAPKTSAASD